MRISESSVKPVLLAVGVTAIVIISVGLARQEPPSIANQFTVESVKSIGQLVVMQAVLKEITTAAIDIDSRGRALDEPKKAAYIITFEVEFLYDLKNGPLNITVEENEEDPNRKATIEMPPVNIVYNMKNIEIYDEQEGSWWGLSQDLTIGDKNALIQQAREAAFQQAQSFISQYKGQYENSAATTMKALAGAFGSTDVTILFRENATETMVLE